MRIAICFSGQIRTGVRASPNILHFIGDLLPCVDFFIHTWDINTTKCLEFGCQYANKHSLANDIAQLTEIYKPKIYKVEKTEEVFNAFKDSCNGTIAKKRPGFGWTHRFYSWRKSIEYKMQYEEQNNFKYDYVVKLRPDCIISPNIQLKDYLPFIESDVFAVNHFIDPAGPNLALDDLLFISSSDVSNEVSKWNDVAVSQWESPSRMTPYVNLHTIFFDYVVYRGYRPYDLHFHDNIAVYRPESLIFDPVDEYNKCFEIDAILTPNSRRISHYRDLQYLSLDELNKVRMRIKIQHQHDIDTRFVFHDKIMKSIKVVNKHWGEEKWIADGTDQSYALKKILFRAGNRTSLQVHRYKYETSYVLSGMGRLFVSKEKFDIENFLIHGMSREEVEHFEKTFDVYDLVPGKVFDIPPGYVHRVVATTDLEFIEASSPELDDVIRLQDDQGRTHGRIDSEHKE
jgi:mannose-6-phosphate isomerase-like protein (cupin superfamily)